MEISTPFLDVSRLGRGKLFFRSSYAFCVFLADCRNVARELKSRLLVLFESGSISHGLLAFYFGLLLEVNRVKQSVDKLAEVRVLLELHVQRPAARAAAVDVPDEFLQLRAGQRALNLRRES